MRVLIIAHGHPDLRAGGAERAAYSTFQRLKKISGFTPTFVATTEPGAIGHDGAFGAFRGRPDELLWTPPAIDGFRLTSQRYDALKEQCTELIAAVEPDVIHFHHYVHLGVEVFPIMRALTPATQVLTLHEYILICNYFGQMLKAQTRALCHTSSHSECAQCFPHFTSGQFFVRKRLLQECLDAVDQIIAPSQFLKQRFTDWGVDAGKIAVIENFLPDHLMAEADPPAPPAPGRLRLGFFGQHNPFKGADVLLDALAHLSDDALYRLELVMFGANFEVQPEDYRAKIQGLMAANAKARLSWYGAYRNEDVIALMRGVDWIVVPSIWWENSPLVIQEAKAAGRPVLCSNIGGMREKVIDGVTGLHFRVGNAFDLASKLERIAAGSAQLRVEATDVEQHNTACRDAHIALYSKPRKAQRAAHLV